MYTLDETGTCRHCKKDAQHEAMQCWICSDTYHVIECETEPMIQSTFLKNQWNNFVKKYPSMTFSCPKCREDMKTKQEVVMSGRVRLLEEHALNTRNRLDEIVGILGKLADKKVPVDNQAPTYADIATKNEPSVIVVDKADEEQDAEEIQAKINEVTKAAIQHKAGVKRSFTNKSGQTVFVCGNAKSKDTLLPHVQKAFQTRKINTPKPRMPTISVPFIDENYTKGELLTVLRNQNEEEGIMFNEQNTEVIFIAPMKDQEQERYQAVIRVSGTIRDRIKANGNRVFVGSTSCPVYDRFFIKRCNRCQEFHHFAKDCKKTEVCALCTANHATRSCNQDEAHYKCVNCVKSGKGDDEVWHPAYHHECPSYVAEQDKLKKSIHYYTKNP